MTALLRSWRALGVVCAVLALVLTLGGCRRRAKPHSNANTSSSTLNSGDPEQAKRNAQSLVDQGKELYKNDEDKEALEKFKQAVALDPNNAEAHLWLGRSYG